MTLPAMDALRKAFGSRLQENVVLASYTTARTGGPADALLPANTADELAEAARILWDLDTPFWVLGSGSNLLVSDQGVRGVVVLNRARNVRVEANHLPTGVWAESGANMGTVARQAGLRGLSGLEWAATVPGTLGGAVYGNAGAHGSDMQKSLVLAEILHRESGRETWPVERLGYQYRSSILKREHQPAIILSAQIHLTPADPAQVREHMDAFNAHRRSTQPPGATMGSMFKNPPGDYAGRLIEAAGLKGSRVGNAEISSVHANFFVNTGEARAADIYQLIRLAQDTVADKFGVRLELEVELVGLFDQVEQAD